MENTEFPTGTVKGENCDGTHVAEFDHYQRFGSGELVYAVVCTQDWMTDYYMQHAVNFDGTV